MKKRRKREAEGNLFLILYLAGLTIGVLWMNIESKLSGLPLETEGLTCLTAVLGEEWEPGAYFLSLLGRRGGVLAAVVFSAVTIFGAPLTVLLTLGMGVLTGGVLTLGLLGLGLKGGALALGIFLPHYLLYVPAWLALCRICCKISLDSWRTMRLPLEEFRRSLPRLLALSGIYGVGILLEAYGNPWVVQFLIKNLKIF